MLSTSLLMEAYLCGTENVTGEKIYETYLGLKHATKMSEQQWKSRKLGE